MSTLALVRHGQASFFSENYDRLSETGRLQARSLAEYWRRTGTGFDGVYTGSLERQQDTAVEVREALKASGLGFPEPRVMAEWNEYDDSMLGAVSIEELVGGDPAAAEDREAMARRFQKGFEILMQEWVAGTRVVEGGESWSEFQSRVVRGLERVTAAHPRGARVAVFSSGGAIAVAIGHVLGLDDRTTLELNWTLRNCSVSEILYNREKMSLSSFNSVGHLEKDLLTYR
jgi:broad specificity phosphatase PhoE